MNLHHLNFGWLHSPPLPPAACHCLVVHDGQRVLLVDTGIGLHDIQDPVGRIGAETIAAAGFQFLPELTATAQLEQLGFAPEAVTDIVLTHCDPDHAGGLSDFPAAHIHLAAEELANLQSGNPRYRSPQFGHGPHWAPVEHEDSTLFGLPCRRLITSLNLEMMLVPLTGHTLGHCGVAVCLDSRWTLHVGDAYYLRAELTDPNHPIDALAALRADDDRLRRRSLAQLRRLRSDFPDLAMNGYHDSSELSTFP